MQISTNTTGMEAGLTVATDKDGRDYCVVVIKGTFVTDDGESILAEEQEPLVHADAHYGDPVETSIQYECDFARFKPRADVVVNGHAYSPTGQPVDEVEVSLEVNSLKKSVRVVGDRKWELGALRPRISKPTPFLKMPLVYERAFGGSDHTHDKPKYQGTELRNLVGVGFQKNSDPKSIEGTPLPNLEDPRHPIRGWSDTPPPAGFGILGRGWQPRITHAGTYDDKWLDHRFPFLPEDFDERYFQSAPADQQVPFFKGGEVVRCTNMTPDGRFEVTVPRVNVPILFRFRDREVEADPNIDTLIVEPDENRFLLTWRATVPIGPRLHALREVFVGRRPLPQRERGAKRRFETLNEMIVWEKKFGGSRTDRKG